MYKVILIAALIGVAFGGNPSTISSSLLNSLGSDIPLNIMISFNQGNEEILKSIETKSFPSRAAKNVALKTDLQQQADLSQEHVLAYLTDNQVTFKSFWVTNQISIRGASKEVIQAVANLPNVKLVDLEKTVQLLKPIEESSEFSPVGSQGINWGTDKIKAQEAWKITNGSGVTVANIDTGVRLSHEALISNWAGEWYDPVNGRKEPYDDQGHGSHVMGTICGTTQEIGIAPGAKWIACKGFGDWGTGWQSLIIDCGQWLICPDDKCTKAPVAVANSWGDEPDATENWFQPVTDAWIAAGIVPVFALGNEGPSCSTSNGPGNTTRVIAVGATTPNDGIAFFSSVGPTKDGRIKPEVSAPGQAIQSVSHASDTGYRSLSGTSMATPHIAGTVALLKSLNVSLTYDEVKDALMTAVDQDLTFQNVACGGRSDNQFPNNHFGAGRINALKLVQVATGKH